MSIRRTVVATFSSYSFAARAIQMVEAKRLANSQISLVYRPDPDQETEAASELNPFPDMEGVLVATGKIDMPGTGKVSAAGPLAGMLQKSPENGISQALEHYGLSSSRADYYARQVAKEKTLVLIETNNDKVNNLANLLAKWGQKMWKNGVKTWASPFTPTTKLTHFFFPKSLFNLFVS